MTSDVLSMSRDSRGELSAGTDERAEGSRDACLAGPVLQVRPEGSAQQQLNACALLVSARIRRRQTLDRLDAVCVERGLR